MLVKSAPHVKKNTLSLGICIRILRDALLIDSLTSQCAFEVFAPNEKMATLHLMSSRPNERVANFSN